MNISFKKPGSGNRGGLGTRGFTLIEVLLVIVIILMLAAALVVFVLPQQEGAEKNTTRLLLSQVETALDNYRLNVGRYPTEEEGGLGALLVKPNFEDEKLGQKWTGPYVKRGAKLEDPWGHQLHYEVIDRSLEENKNGPAYKLFSLGPDGLADTEDDIRLYDEEKTEKDATSVLEEKP
jgi:general secretion pathway protein G